MVNEELVEQLAAAFHKIEKYDIYAIEVIVAATDRDDFKNHMDEYAFALDFSDPGKVYLWGSEVIYSETQTPGVITVRPTPLPDISTDLVFITSDPS
jgi:hypothetical protein